MGWPTASPLLLLLETRFERFMTATTRRRQRRYSCIDASKGRFFFCSTHCFGMVGYTAYYSGNKCRKKRSIKKGGWEVVE